MSYEKFKDVVFSTEPSKMMFHIYKNGLFIGTPVLSVEPYYETSGVQVNFNGGNFHVWKENKITECQRPANLLAECEVCFSLNNEYDEHIGYLYIPKKLA